MSREAANIHLADYGLRNGPTKRDIPSQSKVRGRRPHASALSPGRQAFAPPPGFAVPAGRCSSRKDRGTAWLGKRGPGAGWSGWGSRAFSSKIRCSIPLTERAAHEAAMGGHSAGGVLTAPARKWMQTRVCKISRSLTRPPCNPAPYVGHELNGGFRSPRTPPPRLPSHEEPRSLALSWSFAMVNWPEVLRHAEEWADGFWTGAASASLMLIAGAAFVVLVRAM